MSDNRKSVMISNSDGKTENSNGASMKMETRRMTNEKVMLKERRISSKKGGMGTIITARMTTTPTATDISLDRLNNCNTESDTIA